MLARSRRIQHPMGEEIRTPLLLPSFSSRGFGLKSTDKKTKSEVSNIFSDVTEFLEEPFLVSAYDLYKNFLPPAKKIARVAEVIFVDSGGYETGGTEDLSAIIANYPLDGDWNPKTHLDTLKTWPVHKAAVFVSYDGHKRRKFELQIKAAQALGHKFPSQMINFLMKPERKLTNKKESQLDLDVVGAHIEKLKVFDVIGVTEKEIGTTIEKRMKRIAKLRRMLDEAEVTAPIHIFGSLDPLSTWLYFLSGAEIFDGLTWLRYLYSNGLAIYKNNYCAIEDSFSRNEESVTKLSAMRNLSYLTNMQNAMQLFTTNQNWSVIGAYSEKIREAAEQIAAFVEGE